jgi:hypothetical protein
MLMGTFCRFSWTLRAVTTTSARPPPPLVAAAAAVSANAGPREVATPASAAATATPIFVRAQRDDRSVAPGNDPATRIRLCELITASPNQLT